MKKRFFVSLAMILVLLFTALAGHSYASPIRDKVSIAEDSLMSQSLDSQAVDANLSIELIDLEEPVPHEGGMIASLGPISTKQALVINGEENLLLCTFDDPVTACENLKKEIPDFLQVMQEGFGLSDFSYTTWEEYADHIFSVTQLDNYDADTMVESKVFFLKFKDIIENDAENDEIVMYTQSRGNIDIEALALMLPYTDPLPKSIEKKITPESRAVAQIFNKVKGTEYAMKYAENPNAPVAYQYLGEAGDCANFTSQILENGDIQQHRESPDVNKGWWHDRSYFNVHTHSKSWAGAHSFRYFMGYSDVTTNFSTFSKNLAAGYFICLDLKGDNAWDHMGYVTQVGSYGNYGGKYYKDFKVAQHSDNYHAWVSSADNDWEIYEDGLTKYCIVRKQ